ncbi:MAG TPA: diguanylate cyclase [Burkholderiales bacterium]|nr:diguanylate cyclase [Burkholderiales bacterium]
MKMVAAVRFIERHIVLVSYVVSAGMIGALALASYEALRDAENSDAWALHTVHAIAELEQMNVAVVEAESAGRAFLLTGDPTFITRFKALDAATEERIGQFRSLTSDNRAQDELARSLTQIVDRRFAFLESQINARLQGSPVSALIPLARRGIAEMESIRATIEIMRQAEEQLLHDRLQHVLASQRTAGAVLVFAAATGIVLLTLSFLYAHSLAKARAAAEAAAVHLAHHDALTGLPNRRLLDDRLTLALARARRHGTSMAVLCLDLDGFKKVNDTHGHAVGDELLKQVAQRLRDTLRAADTVARTGGDEFVVALPDADGAGAAQTAGKIIAAVSKSYELSAGTASIGTSIGISIHPKHGATTEELLKKADDALYAAKTAGKLRFEMAV